MTRKSKKSPSVADPMTTPSAGVAWKYTKVMNMRDLSRDEDYLSHLFVEKLGSLGSSTPLVVHKMDPLRRLPKTDACSILAIVQRVSLLITGPSLFARALLFWSANSRSSAAYSRETRRTCRH